MADEIKLRFSYLFICGLLNLFGNWCGLSWSAFPPPGEKISDNGKIDEENAAFVLFRFAQNDVTSRGSHK